MTVGWANDPPDTTAPAPPDYGRSRGVDGRVGPWANPARVAWTLLVPLTGRSGFLIQFDQHRQGQSDTGPLTGRRRSSSAAVTSK